MALLLACALATACGVDAPAGPAAAGRYELDREDYARRLVRARLKAAGRTAASTPTVDQRQRIVADARKLAAGLRVHLELRADGAFLARFQAGTDRSRFGGAWTRAGNQLTLRTTLAPSGEVTTVPDVEAVLTTEGLLFSGWLVPHDFLLRRLP